MNESRFHTKDFEMDLECETDFSKDTHAKLSLNSQGDGAVKVTHDVQDLAALSFEVKEEGQDSERGRDRQTDRQLLQTKLTSRLRTRTIVAASSIRQIDDASFICLLLQLLALPHSLTPSLPHQK